jgi:hexosaminidase
MRYYITLILIIALFTSCSNNKSTGYLPTVIPVPYQMEVKKGSFEITGKTDIITNSQDENVRLVAEGLQAKLSAFAGKQLTIGQFSGSQPGNSIFLKIDETQSARLGKEGYLMSINPSGIEITAPFAAGLFYGIQTLYQLLPPEIYGDPAKNKGKDIDLEIKCMEIIDFPQFSWRGMHLDVSRHFFPKEFVKKYIDLIAMHKMNVFHWHLTDDNGWRIAIDQYPKLTEVSAWHADRAGVPWNEARPQQPGEAATYGGFYTKDDIREIVEYARQRFITVVPEIEMPGHVSEIFAAYPEYSCSGKQIPVQTGSYWPNTDIFCAGKDETFRFIQNILDEVIPLFPSEYIHIGGDEADKTAWKACPDCQARIRKEGLKGVDELQSYFVKRIEKYLVSKGKKMIGWDEILEGGLAPEATVMSWRGFEGGIEAAKQGHKVVMCPTSYCYFDYYQADKEFQPPASGGLITLKKVYSFRPVPSELNAMERQLILGGQGNIWTEYIDNPSHAEYMALPRMTALAEVLWSPANKLIWEDFRNRLQTQLSRFNNLEVNYFPGSAKVQPSTDYDPKEKVMKVELETEMTGTSVYYTLNGNVPDNSSFKYNKPFKIDHDVVLKAIAYKDDQPLEKNSEFSLTFHKLIGKNVHYKHMYSERYPAGGNTTLNDGIRGTLNYDDGYWQGFYGDTMDVVFNFNEDFTFKSITSTYLLDQKKWIFIPEKVNYYISNDGQNFQLIASVKHKIPLDGKEVLTNDFSITLNRDMKVRFLRVEAVNIGVCPDWHPGKGQKAWLFADEIVVK